MAARSDEDGYFASMELEAAAQAAAAEAGAPVPHVLLASDSVAALGNAFLICDEIAGETIVRRIQRGHDDAGRRRLLTQCGQALAAIHRARADAPGLDEHDQLDQYRQRVDDMGDTTATFGNQANHALKFTQLALAWVVELASDSTPAAAATASTGKTAAPLPLARAR